MLIFCAKILNKSDLSLNKRNFWLCWILFHRKKSPPPEFPFIGWTLLFIADNDAEDGNNSLTGIDWGHLCTQRALFSGDCHNGARTKTCSSWAAQRLSGVCILRHPGPGKVLEHIKIFRKWLKSYKICTRRNHNISAQQPPVISAITRPGSDGQTRCRLLAETRQLYISKLF